MRKNRGITLMELILYVAISSIILLITSLFLSTLLESRIKNRTIAEVEQQGIQVMQTITQAIKNADSVTTPTQGDQTGPLILVTDSVSTIFNQSSFPSPNENVSGIFENGVPLTSTRVTLPASSLKFTNLSEGSAPASIRIEFTLKYMNFSGKNEYDFSKNFTGSATLRKYQ